MAVPAEEFIELEYRAGLRSHETLSSWEASRNSSALASWTTWT